MNSNYMLFLCTGVSGEDVTIAASAQAGQKVPTVGGGQGRGRGQAALQAVFKDYPGAVQKQVPSVLKVHLIFNGEQQPREQLPAH